MDAFARDLRKRDRVERIAARYNRYRERCIAGDRDPRRIKRMARLLWLTKRIMEVRRLRFAANGYRTRP